MRRPCRVFPGGKFFSEQYGKAGSRRAPKLWPFSYAAANLLIETIEKVGPDRAAITKALGSVKDRPSIIGPITFDDYGQNITPLTTKYVVQDGKWVVWE